MKRPDRAQLVKLGAIALVVVVVGGVAWRYFHLGDEMLRAVDFFRAAGPWPFFTAMALLPLVGCPLSPFTVAAGPVFGPQLGVGWVIAAALVAVASNVAIAYGIAAYALQPPLSRWMARRGYAVPKFERDTAWTVILLVRVVPAAPFFLQSYLLGLARVPFVPYLVVSMVVQAAYISITILFGDALMRGDRGVMIGAAVLFVVVGGVLHQVRRRMKNGATTAGPV